MQSQGQYVVDMPVESALSACIPVEKMVDEAQGIIYGQRVQYKIVRPLLGGTQCGCYLVENNEKSTAQNNLFVAKVKPSTLYIRRCAAWS